MTSNPTDNTEPGTPQKVERLSFWPNLSQSFKHIRESVKHEGHRMRKSDPLTVWLVPSLAVILAVVSMSTGHLRVAVGVLAYISVLAYIGARIGIVRSMSFRQTNLVWHVMLATFISGLLFALIVFEFVQIFN